MIGIQNAHHDSDHDLLFIFKGHIKKRENFLHSKYQYDFEYNVRQCDITEITNYCPIPITQPRIGSHASITTSVDSVGQKKNGQICAR